MRDLFPFGRAVCAVLSLGVHGLANGHAMPTRIAEDQTWRLWPDGVVAYELIDRPLPADGAAIQPQRPVDAAARAALEAAMRQIQQQTGGAIVFVPSTDHPRRVRISLMPDNPDVGFCGLASVGQVAITGALQIADRAVCKTRAVALHELMHTLGFLHENQRFQAIMDRERRPWARSAYADTRDTVDHDSITYNDGLQGERLDILQAPADVLLVRLRHGLESTGRWFQELSRQDVAAILRYYPPDRMLARQLARAARERPGLAFTRLELASGQCLQTGPARKEDGWRELFVTRCDTVSAGQRWALDAQGALHSLPFPGQCVSKLPPPGRHADSGGLAILSDCRPGDPRQQWEVRDARLRNRAQPQLQLSYAPVERNVLVWDARDDLVVDWRRHAAPAWRPAGLPGAEASAADPWRKRLRARRHEADKVFRLQRGGQCLHDAGPDTHRPDPEARRVALAPCGQDRHQLWLLDQGRLVSLAQPAYCLDEAGPHTTSGATQPAYAGLLRCRQGHPAQQWTLQGIDGTDELMITSRRNPLVADDYRLLEAGPDGLLRLGDASAPRARVAWHAIALQAPATRPAVIERSGGPAANGKVTASGQAIRLLGGDLPVRGAALCLSALPTAHAGFVAGERGIAALRCDGSAGQQWTLHTDGRLTTPAAPGLCLGRNRARLGQETHGSYRRRAFRHTGLAALQPCRADAPTQQWQWRATRYHHQAERAGHSGAQLTLRQAPDLSLIVHGKARGPQIAIGQADIANHFQFFRWHPTHAPAGLAGAPGGARALEWDRDEASWTRDAPGYIGKGVFMTDWQGFEPLRWQHGQRCLGLRPDGAWRLSLSVCRGGAPEQGWRIDAQHRLVNQRHPGLCLLRAQGRPVLGDCTSADALPHWYLNDSRQLDSLDLAPLRLRPGRHGDIELVDTAFQGAGEGWYRP